MSELIDEVSSIEVESQNLITSYDNKMHREEENGIHFGNFMVKNKIEGMAGKNRSESKTKTITISKEEKVRIKITSKHKSKKTSVTRKIHSKSDKKTNSHMRMTTERNHKPETMKTIPRPMHNSLNHKIHSSEKNIMAWNSKKYLNIEKSKIKKKKKSEYGNKEQSREKEKSKSKSKSKSRSKKKTSF